MASIVLQQPTLLLESDRTRLLHLLMLGDARTLTDSVVGEVRRYANGTTRLIRRAGRDQRVQLTVAVDAARLEDLRVFAGQLLLYRDGHGTKMWCTFLPLEVNPIQNGRLFSVQLDLQAVTFSEAV